MNIPPSILTLIIGIAITLISLWYGQNHGLMPVAASETAKQIDDLFNLMMTIATGLFFLVEGVLIFCVIKFRRRKGDTTDGPAIEGNVPLEILWTALPTIIVFVLAIYSFEVYNNLGGLDPMASHDNHPYKTAQHENKADSTLLALDPNQSKIALGIGPSLDANSNQPPLVVDVKGIQYAWIFTYPETGITSGELHVPAGRTVELNLSAGDVIHAFWVPELRLKQDAIPGRDTLLSFNANREGQYPVICAELCGSYHGAMKTVLYVHSEDDYSQWVQSNTLAQKDQPEQVVAVNPATLSDGEFLAPYAQEMGIETTTVQQVQMVHHHHHH